jgi:hypothetical protein
MSDCSFVPFCFDHSVVCSSTIYELWLPIRSHLLTEHEKDHNVTLEITVPGLARAQKCELRCSRRECSSCSIILLNQTKLVGPFDFNIRIMVFNDTFKNISAISWWSVLLVKETEVPGNNHQPVVSHWQTLSPNVVSSAPYHEHDSNS